MSRLKKKRSINLDKARARSSALRSIDPVLDFGKGLSIDTFNQLIEQTGQALADYNTALSTIDKLYNTFKALERSLNDMSDRMLTGIATQYGKDSDEYEMAGGTRKSEHRRYRQQTTPEPVTTPVGLD